jgi:hypothetical protein
MPNNLLRQPNFAALVTLVWLLVALGLLLQFWTQTAETLLDTDDAMRLVEMRAWLGGHGWFDLHEARLQPPLGYDAHWSRLVDAGLAGLFVIFNWIDPQSAERLMRAWWPLLWLLPTIAGMVAIAWRVAGREAAMVSLLLALVGVPAYQQFTPGRIDHHNVQIALTLLVVAAAVWSDRKHWAAVAAGAISGLALAIGLESVPYLAMCGAALSIRQVFGRNFNRALRDYGLALAIGASVAFLVSIAPQRWTMAHCDAIAINNAAAVICVGLMLALASFVGHQEVLTRALAVAGAGTLSLAVFVLFEPRCVHGPFAMVDPAIWPVWHSYVRELQPLLDVFRVNPLTAAGIAAFPAVAAIATLALISDPVLRRDFGFLTAATVFLFAAATMIVAIRAYSYAIWLGMPMVAAAAPRVFAALKLQSVPARLGAALLLTPLVVSSGAIAVAHGNGLNDTDSFARPASRQCLQTASYAPMAMLPPGLVVTDISYGPYLLALTPHSAMAAPYHRLGAGIVTAHRALASPPDEARGILKDAGATYVMICGPRPPDGLKEPARGRSLWGRLQAGAVPDWLTPLQLPGGGPFAVYQVKS